MPEKTISFLASFPAIQSAIRVGDDGMRIQLQIPESELHKALWLIEMRDKALLVTVQVQNGGNSQTKNDIIDTQDYTIDHGIKNDGA